MGFNLTGEMDGVWKGGLVNGRGFKKSFMFYTNTTRITTLFIVHRLGEQKQQVWSETKHRDKKDLRGSGKESSSVQI